METLVTRTTPRLYPGPRPDCTPDHAPTVPRTMMHQFEATLLLFFSTGIIRLSSSPGFFFVSKKDCTLRPSTVA